MLAAGRAPMRAAARQSAHAPRPVGLARGAQRGAAPTLPLQHAHRAAVAAAASPEQRSGPQPAPDGEQQLQAAGTPQQQPRLPAWLPRAAALAACAALLSCAAPAVAHAAAKASAASAADGGSSLVQTLISFILHLDKHMAALIAAHGPTTYALLWAIVFCETGLVLTPFLPGDSLLFAAGAFAGMGKLDVKILFAVFMTSAILGDAVNYAIGSRLGRWALGKQLLNPQHIAQTSKFYAKYGGKTVVLARFVPIVRTFAPFVAGIGSMEYPKFAAYNVIGALIWTILFVGAGFFFGNLPVVQHNFTLVVLGIVAISVVPVLLEVLAARREAAAGGDSSGGNGKPEAA